MNKKILIISPHPDDASFSLGGFILANYDKSIIVWDVFSKQEYSIKAGVDKSSKQQIVEEEYKAMSALNKEVILSDLPEAGLRGYKKLSTILNNTSTVKKNTPIYQKVKEIFQKVVKTINPNTILIPLGCGAHIDHLIVREVVLEWWNIYGRNQEVYLYEELPYALNEKWYEEAMKIGRMYGLGEYLYDISKVIKEKAEVMSIYKSQVKDRDIKNMIQYSKTIKKGKIIERVWKINDIFTKQG